LCSGRDSAHTQCSISASDIKGRDRLPRLFFKTLLRFFQVTLWQSRSCIVFTCSQVSSGFSHLSSCYLLSVHSFIMARSFVLSSLSLLILSSSVLSSPIVSTSAVVILSCPDANGYKYEISGRTYVVQCSTTYSGSNLVEASHLSTTFQECVDACVGKVGCKAVSYIEKSKQCYLKSKVGTSKQSDDTTGAALLASSPAIPPPANLAVCEYSSLLFSVSQLTITSIFLDHPSGICSCCQQPGCCFTRPSSSGSSCCPSFMSSFE
jgi:hypothetical protein